MDLKINAFGRNSLRWMAVALLVASVGSLVFPVFGLPFVVPVTGAAFAVGGLHGLAGLWWDEARACAVAGLLLNLMGVGAALWV